MTNRLKNCGKAVVLDTGSTYFCCDTRPNLSRVVVCVPTRFEANTAQHTAAAAAAAMVTYYVGVNGRVIVRQGVEANRKTVELECRFVILV